MFLRQHLQIGQLCELVRVRVGDEIGKQKHDRHAPKLASQKTQGELPVGSRVSRLQIIELLDSTPHVRAALASGFVRVDGLAESQDAKLAASAHGRKPASGAALHYA